MRESVGNTWTIGLVFTFILLFSAFLSLAINYSRVFKVKNETLSIIEKYEGYNSASREIINNYLKAAGYKSTGSCPGNKEYYGETSLDNTGRVIKYAEGNNNYYCVKWNNDLKNYEIILFFRFDLPIIGDLGAYNIRGRTKTISYNQGIIS